MPHWQAYGPLSGGRIERAAGQRGPANAVVRRVAAEASRTPAQVLLRWAMQRGVSVLPKSTRTEGVEENARANDFSLTAQQMAALNALETGEPSYWDPRCVDSLDTFNIYLDRERLQRQLSGR